MSLSFVSKSVQTANDDGGYEEKPIEGVSPADDVPVAKPLHQQLLENQQKAQNLQEEQERANMRGALALDEEDAAHLDALQRQRERERSRLQQDTEEQLAAFRAARMDRSEISESLPVHNHDVLPTAIIATGELDATLKHADSKRAYSSNGKQHTPTILVKKRKRKSGDAPAPKAEDTTSAPTAPAPENKSNVGLGGLLSGYGSSSDEGAG